MNKSIDESSDPLAIACDQPNLDELLAEFKMADGANSGLARLARSDAVRYCRWSGQSMDGKKHKELLPEGTKVLPWNMSSDARVFLVDSVVNSIVDQLCVSIQMARLEVTPANARMRSLSAASELKRVMGWLKAGPMAAIMESEAEYAAQIGTQYGHVYFYCGWEQERILEKKRIDLQAIAQMNPAIAALLSDPDKQDDAAQALLSVFPGLNPKRASAALAALVKTGEAELLIPGEPRQCPVVTVLKPWEDIIVDPGLTDINRARVIFRRERMSVAAMRAKAKQEDWDEEFVLALEGTAGRHDNLFYLSQTTGVNFSYGSDESKTVDVLYAYARQIADEDDGVPGIYCTVMSQYVPDKWGKYELLDYAHGRYPFVCYRAEVSTRLIGETRGVTDVADISQGQAKDAWDCIVNFAQIATIPAMAGPRAQAGNPPKIGPAAYVGEITRGEYRWMDFPSREPRILFEMFGAIKRSVDAYFALPGEATHPAAQQARQIRTIARWLAAWEQVLWQLAVLAYQYIGDDELAGIIGKQPTLSARDIVDYRFALSYNASSLDSDWVLKVLEAAQKYVLPADAAGVIDRSRFMQIILTYLDPTLAQSVMTDHGAASQKMFREVRENVIAMGQGNEAIYAGDDPAARTKLTFLEQIVGANPTYTQELTKDGSRFAALFKKYAANLNQSIVQDQNRITGALGVDPGPGSELPQ